MRLTENYEHSFMTGWSELKSRYGSELAGYRTFGVSFGAVFCCVGAVVRVLKLGWPGFMGGQKVCLGSGFFVVVPRDKSV